ncbi:hypothetical protein D4R87_00240 [bacterium]|nr:MAG: hypothetical protein D4R87_00240 [bacterium]
MKRLLIAVAKVGLSPKQRRLIDKLAERYESIFRGIARIHSDDEDYLQANMMSPALGLQVLERQVSRERREKTEREEIVKKCREAGIAEWRIKLLS